MVGEFSNKAPILRKAAQQDEPGDEYWVIFFIIGLYFYCKFIHYLPVRQIKNIK